MSVEMSLRIGWDCDGVIYDFTAACQTWFHNWYGVPLEQMPAPDRWNTWEVWDMSKGEWTEKVHEGVDAGFIFGVGAPEPEAHVVNALLRGRGHSQHIITNRDYFGTPRENPTYSAAARANTHRWLSVSGLRVDSVNFAADKTSIPADVMIEDNLDNYDALDAAGVHAVLIDRPWNQDDGQRRRIYSLLEFLTVVDELALQRQYDAGMDALPCAVPL